MTISPMMIRVGMTTPAIHGSKYTSISCKPRKYHGAFAGFMVKFGFAGSSSGAFSVMDHTIRMMVTIIAAKLFDQDVIGVRLLPGQVHVESQQRDHGDDRNVVRGGEDFPKLLPIHGYFFASFISESSTTAAGPEMPPSLRTRQKCRIMKIEAMMGMPMQCQM